MNTSTRWELALLKIDSKFRVLEWTGFVVKMYIYSFSFIILILSYCSIHMLANFFWTYNWFSFPRGTELKGHQGIFIISIYCQNVLYLKKWIICFHVYLEQNTNNVSIFKKWHQPWSSLLSGYIDCLLITMKWSNSLIYMSNTLAVNVTF